MKIATSLKGMLSLLALVLTAQIGVSQTVLIGGNQYAFQWTGDPDIGLFFSSTNSRYEFRDLTGAQEVWINPVSRISYFRGQVGINNTIPTGRLDVRSSLTAETAAVIGRGILSPTNGYLGVQGDATNFDGITGLDLYGGFEMGVVGLSTGGSAADNFGVLGYSNGVGMRAEHSVSGITADLAGTDYAGSFAGRVAISTGEAAALTGNGTLMIGDVAAANMVMDANDIQARNNGAASSLLLQKYGGNVAIGVLAPTAPTERLFVNSETGQDPMRVRIAGSTKFLINDNGGTTIGVFSTAVPANGLYVQGNVKFGATEATGYRLSVDGKIICEEVTVQNSTSWPDYVFQDDYQLRSLDVLSQEIDELGHLPGIPSAAEVAENGAGVGEMNRLLLEKVEELTLYVIDLQEQIKEIKEEK